MFFAGKQKVYDCSCLATFGVQGLWCTIYVITRQGEPTP